MQTNSGFWESLNSRDQNDYEKRFHDLARQFRDDTRKHPMNINLGNLDAEGIYAPVRDHFQSEPKPRFCGNGIGAKIDSLPLLRYPGMSIQVIRKAKQFLA